MSWVSIEVVTSLRKILSLLISSQKVESPGRNVGVALGGSVFQ